ncbi:HU family DNA-binding protein [Agathobaculum sp.]|uniref:HU family DNA-binding protein n=1 Tax=Agathobaculum sp. TaxID=2048138 RepID=UPI002A816EDC|nr:HU family DNA-binding protein [Agathobaculum sp.]MDY3617898.1 HU family DNA-binding protein [Agathobaculum sp.]
MKKSDFVTLVAEKTGMSKKDTEKTIDAVFAAMSDVLAEGDKLQMSGFGTFETKTRAARTGHNPRTGESIEIAAATIPTFKPGKALKDRVNAK